MSLQGLVDPILCINKDHETYMVSYWNELDERTEWRCIYGECDYKIVPGLTMYEKMIEEIKKHD